MGADELRTAAHPTQLIVPSSEDLKPKAMRVMSRILVLTDSVRGAPLSVSTVPLCRMTKSPLMTVPSVKS